jgi:hypothetical protein
MMCYDPPTFHSYAQTRHGRQVSLRPTFNGIRNAQTFTGTLAARRGIRKPIITYMAYQTCAKRSLFESFSLQTSDRRRRVQATTPWSAKSFSSPISGWLRSTLNAGKDNKCTEHDLVQAGGAALSSDAAGAAKLLKTDGSQPGQHGVPGGLDQLTVTVHNGMHEV